MATKFENFLKDKKIDPRRLCAASRQIERLRPEDRQIKLKKRQARKSEDASKAQDLGERRSGRTVTPATVDKAISGKAISGPAKTRLLRAINRVLEQKKQSPVTLGDLFDPPAKKAAAEQE